jgi:putative tryptophan/tyrosine transport system substrate-binding protein
MDRRAFIATLAGGIATVSMVGAQQPVMPVIGFLGGTAPAPEVIAPFLGGLAELGFSDGRNVAIQYRWAQDQADRLPALVADLLRNQVVVIVTSGGMTTARTARAATTTVPIVFEVGRDPVTAGLVASLNRPGGNATGVYMLTGDLNAKRLGLLREMVPRAATIATLINPKNAGAQAIEKEVRAAAATAGVQVHVVHAGTDREIDAAFAILVEKRIGGLIVSNDPFFNNKREQLVTLATRHALPTIFEWREFTAIGGLMSYGTDISGVYRQLGVYVARILKGAKPADLPVIQPTKFELVINQKTAKALGLTIPQSLRVQAELIE